MHHGHLSLHVTNSLEETGPMGDFKIDSTTEFALKCHIKLCLRLQLAPSTSLLWVQSKKTNQQPAVERAVHN